MTTSSDITTRPAGTPGTGAPPASRLEPGVCRELLARALVQARRDRGLTQQREAAVLGWSLAKLNRIENGTAAIKADDLRGALSLYEVTDPAQAGRLTWLARAGKGRPWYGQHPAITPGLGAYLQAERSAAAISGYRVRTVPGLLQTPDYTRAILTARRVSQPAERAALIAASRFTAAYRRRYPGAPATGANPTRPPVTVTGADPARIQDMIATGELSCFHAEGRPDAQDE